MKDYKELSRIEFNRQAEKFDNATDWYQLCKDSYDPANKEIKSKPFNDFLDIGCGTGNTIEMLVKDYPNAKFTGLDLAEKMIEVAKKKVPQENVEFIVGDAENLPFKDNSYDVILCKESIHHYPEPEKFFNECQRVLRPNGRLIIVDMNLIPPIRTLWNYVLSPYLINMGDCHFYNENEIREYYNKYGMEVTKFETFPKMRFIVSGYKKNDNKINDEMINIQKEN